MEKKKCLETHDIRFMSTADILSLLRERMDFFYCVGIKTEDGGRNIIFTSFKKTIIKTEEKSVLREILKTFFGEKVLKKLR